MRSTISSMKTPFDIVTDLDSRMMRITFTGNWTVETVEDLRRETRTKVARLIAAGCPPRDLLILMDRRQQGAHPQDVVEALKVLSTENSGKAKRVAMLVTSALAKMQVGRINQSGTTRVFDAEAAALAWLQTGRD